jgi:4-hydroxy-3-methylbut-2-enyl diphosphate reductase
MSGLLIVAPMRLEALAIGSVVSTAEVRRTGMGIDRSFAAARVLKGNPPAALLVMGFCGGLDESSEPGEVVVCDRVLPNEFTGRDEIPAAPMVCAGTDALAGALEGNGLRVRRGMIISLAGPVRGSRRGHYRKRGAIAADMESAWLARGLYGQKVDGQPFAVVRVVVDTPTRELMRLLATVGGGLRALRELRRAARAVNELMREHDVHTVFGDSLGDQEQTG